MDKVPKQEQQQEQQQQDDENYYKKYLNYKTKYEDLLKQVKDGSEKKTKTWKDLEYGLMLLTSKNVGTNFKSNIFSIIKKAVVGATKTLVPGMGIVSNLLENSVNTNNIFKNLQFNDFIFNKFKNSKEHKHLKKIFELIDIDDDFISIINPNIMKEFMKKISNLITNQSRNNPGFLNQELPDMDEELIDFIWHKFNIDLSEISLKNNKKRRTKEFIESDNDNMSYLKGLLQEREDINKERTEQLLNLKVNSNFFLKNITGY
jgi:hypothetical protein